MSREYIFVVCRRFRLTKAHRLEVATYVLNANVESFNQLGPVDMARLTDAFRGAEAIANIIMERNRGERI